MLQFKKKESKDFYDIPGGKIEKNETSLETSIREFKEETGMDILSQTYKGNVIVEYPNRIFDFDIYIADKYSGKPKEFEENKSAWVNIEELFSKSKIYPSIEIIKYLKEDNINLIIYVDKNNKIIKVERKKLD